MIWGVIGMIIGIIKGRPINHLQFQQRWVVGGGSPLGHIILLELLAGQQILIFSEKVAIVSRKALQKTNPIT